MRPCDPVDAVFDSSVDMLVVPIAMQAPIKGNNKHNHCQFEGVIINTSNSPNEIAQELVMTRGAQRSPIGLIKSHCVLTMETLV